MSTKDRNFSTITKWKWLFYILIIFSIILFVLNLFWINFTPWNLKHHKRNMQYLLNYTKLKINSSLYNSQLFTICQEECCIPYLEPYDLSIEKFIRTPDPINCQTNIPEIITQTENKLFINSKEFAVVKCCYRYFLRRNPTADEKDIQFNISSLCIDMENNEFTIIDHEFIIVLCVIDQKNFTYLYSFIQTKKIIHKLKLHENKSDEYLSVLVLGIDSMSRLNFQRQMPKSYNYLTHTLDSKEMIGYNKVDDNTFPNLMVVLTGLTANEIENKYLINRNNRRFDSCPLIWKLFNESGFITAYGEDIAYEYGLFSYLQKGFFNSPTDFDYRVFDRVADCEIGHMKKSLGTFCFGNDLRIHKLLKYVKDLATALAKHRYFGFFWSALMTHDYLNGAYLIDDIYYQLLKDLYESGALRNTALFLISDHGTRFGEFRSTYQGHLENSLPTLFIYTPQWFRDKYPLAWVNVITNTDRLITPFDLHETFVDLKNLNLLKNEKIKMRLKFGKLKNISASRGLSLFLPSSKGRTCEIASIPNHFCACQIFQPINVSNNIVKKSVHFLVNKMNMLLSAYSVCAELKLEEIIKASKTIAYIKNTLNNKQNIDLLVTFTTVPGYGMFEATVRWIIGIPKLSGTISRINSYRNQTGCISDYHMELYCYCL